MQFAMNLNGNIKYKRTMAAVVRSTSSVSGVHDILRNYPITENRIVNFHSGIRNSLKSASSQVGFHLNDVQTLAVSKIVHLDSSVIHIPGRMTDFKFSTPISDICRPCILDMPTGSGKTITSLLGGIIFAIERDIEMSINPPVRHEERTGCTEVVNIDRKSNRKCMTFAPKHLVSHWVDQSKVAQKIINVLRPEWKISIYLNKKTDDIFIGEKEIAVIICDNSHGPKKVMNPFEFYPCVCFDESGETSSNSLNQIYDGIKCGRFMMCSADLSRWEWLKPRNNSILRNAFPCWTVTFSQKKDIVLDRILGLEKEDAVLSATISMASVFQKTERDMVLRVSGSALENINLYTSTIKYVPSLLERLGYGSAVDLSDISGGEMFEKSYRVKIYDCKTLGDIINAVEGRIEILRGKNKHIGSYMFQLLQRLKSIAGEDCPICLEKMQEVRVLQPCMHFTCTTCVNKIGRTCPMCRGKLTSTLGVESSLSLKRSAETNVCSNKRGPGNSSIVEKRDIGELFLDEIGLNINSYPVAGGVVPAVNTCLETIMSSHMKRGGGTLKVMLICPGVDVQQNSLATMGYMFYAYRTVGTKADPARRVVMDKVLDKFSSDDGLMKILSVRDNENSEGTLDNMTGLDIDGLDVVVTVGRGSLAQRLGRLCRLTRATLPKEKQSALYVELMSSR